ncbi:MAG: gamma-glutamyl-gamma-aminobutyrate hydrolase family protein [Desulfomonile tiedjei]|uniref:Gamma-glutamyl-gamma-aminobutyrate hydrolase family protein n=1 Tax=Desulfomonile tiedjei TaxID=2358 RepID=A0A9D6V8X7_9BACT|nr:gamma-glutamyl-gamma-aminobutyrate hydrolase family protein [Desulfomonile tiedjei]
MKGSKSSFSRKASLIALACVLIALVSISFFLYPREKIVNGLLVDLELKGPEPGRYEELVKTFTQRLQDEAPAARHIRTKLYYVHYQGLTAELAKERRPDFILLSPQNTPWHMYRDDDGVRLNAAKNVLKKLILEERIPVLGICGGHQFLAMVFGGTVDFIDSRLVGVFPEKYPKQAIAEKGIFDLETLGSDPIFSGVATHPGRFRVVESHHEEVKTVPEPFVNLARSRMSEAQLIRIPGMIVYGMAFHPERSGRSPGNECSEGRIMLGNFVRMVSDQGR